MTAPLKPLPVHLSCRGLFGCWKDFSKEEVFTVKKALNAECTFIGAALSVDTEIKRVFAIVGVIALYISTGLILAVVDLSHAASEREAMRYLKEKRVRIWKKIGVAVAIPCCIAAIYMWRSSFKNIGNVMAGKRGAYKIFGQRVLVINHLRHKGTKKHLKVIRHPYLHLPHKIEESTLALIDKEGSKIDWTPKLMFSRLSTLVHEFGHAISAKVNYKRRSTIYIRTRDYTSRSGGRCCGHFPTKEDFESSIKVASKGSALLNYAAGPFTQYTFHVLLNFFTWSCLRKAASSAGSFLDRRISKTFNVKYADLYSFFLRSISIAISIYLIKETLQSAKLNVFNADIEGGTSDFQRIYQRDKIACYALQKLFWVFPLALSSTILLDLKMRASKLLEISSRKT